MIPKCGPIQTERRIFPLSETRRTAGRLIRGRFCMFVLRKTVVRRQCFKIRRGDISVSLDVCR